MKSRIATWAFAANLFLVPYWAWNTYVNLELTGTFGLWPVFALVSGVSAVALKWR